MTVKCHVMVLSFFLKANLVVLKLEVKQLVFFKKTLFMRGSRKFCQRGPTLTFFLFDEGRKDPNTNISCPSTAWARRTPFKWRFAGGPMMAQHWMLDWWLCDFKGIRTSIPKEPHIFVIFQGCPDPCLPFWIHTRSLKCVLEWYFVPPTVTYFLVFLSMWL